MLANSNVGNCGCGPIIWSISLTMNGNQFPSCYFKNTPYVLLHCDIQTTRRFQYSCSRTGKIIFTIFCRPREKIAICLIIYSILIQYSKACWKLNIFQLHYLYNEITINLHDIDRTLALTNVVYITYLSPKRLIINKASSTLMGNSWIKLKNPHQWEFHKNEENGRRRLISYEHGPNGISLVFVKNYSSLLSKLLSIFTKSLSIGHFPP